MISKLVIHLGSDPGDVLGPVVGAMGTLRSLREGELSHPAKGKFKLIREIP